MFMVIQIMVWHGFAWEDGDSKERASRDQALVKDKWWLERRGTMARVKKRELAFSLSLIKQNEAISWKWVKSLMDNLVEGDLMHLKLIHIYWMESTCSRWLCSKEKIKVDMLAPSLDEDCKTSLRFDKDQLKRFKFLFHLILSK
jgi:hypothetical protein